MYAFGQLAVVLRGEAGANGRFLRLAWAQFIVALFFGSVAAEAFGPSIVDWRAVPVRQQAIWLVVGLVANGVWPAVQRAVADGLRNRIRAWLGHSGADEP